MIIACLDLEGVIFPEIWIRVAETTQIDGLKLTTRDVSDYDELMQHRLKILAEHKITITDIQNVISQIKPLPGAEDFFYKLQENFQVIILSDTFYQFAMPLMKQLHYPTIFCHNLIIDDKGFIKNYKLRIQDSKREAVNNLRKMNFLTIASGDSYNDTTMLMSADRGVFFRPPSTILEEFPQFPVTTEYQDLYNQFMEFKKELSQ